MPTTGPYAYALDQDAQGNIRPLTDTIRIYGITASLYTVNLATHQFLATVPGGAIVGFYTLANKTVTAAVFDNTVDASISNVLNAVVSAYIYVKWTGSAATSILLFYDDDFVSSTADPVSIVFSASGIWEKVAA